MHNHYALTHTHCTNSFVYLCSLLTGPTEENTEVGGRDVIIMDMLLLNK